MRKMTYRKRKTNCEEIRNDKKMGVKKKIKKNSVFRELAIYP